MTGLEAVQDVKPRSHFLPNPLNVAKGRLHLDTANCDSDHLEHIGRAHDQMDTLIDDMLSLARAGAMVGETQAVKLADLVEGFWRNVETASARIITETDETVQADETRLQQLFENLFQNAAEQAGEAVTVTVGKLADGFYVETDGPGIPPDHRDDVFDAGHTTSEAGDWLRIRHRTADRRFPRLACSNKGWFRGRGTVRIYPSVPIRSESPTLPSTPTIAMYGDGAGVGCSHRHSNRRKSRRIAVRHPSPSGTLPCLVPIRRPWSERQSNLPLRHERRIPSDVIDAPLCRTVN